jgi:hypothetical protein
MLVLGVTSATAFERPVAIHGSGATLKEWTEDAKTALDSTSCHGGNGVYDLGGRIE